VVCAFRARSSWWMMIYIYIYINHGRAASRREIGENCDRSRRGKLTQTCDDCFPHFLKQWRNMKSIMQDEFNYILILYSPQWRRNLWCRKIVVCVCECTLQWRRPTVVPRYLSPRIGSPTYGRASGRYYYYCHYNTAATGGPHCGGAVGVVVRPTWNAVLSHWIGKMYTFLYVKEAVVVYRERFLAYHIHVNDT